MGRIDYRLEAHSNVKHEEGHSLSMRRTSVRDDRCALRFSSREIEKSQKMAWTVRTKIRRRKYFIILPGQFANGFSSSPSNTPPPFNAGGFPHVIIGDDVVAQHSRAASSLRFPTCAESSCGTSATTTRLPKPIKWRYRDIAITTVGGALPENAMEWVDIATDQIGFPDGDHGVPAVHSCGPAFHGGGPHGGASH
jgi:hypothetical protein